MLLHPPPSHYAVHDLQRLLSAAAQVQCSDTKDAWPHYNDGAANVPHCSQAEERLRSLVATCLFKLKTNEEEFGELVMSKEHYEDKTHTENNPRNSTVVVL